MKNKRKRQCIAVTLLLALLLQTPVLAQQQKQSIIVDEEGPDYKGNIMMAENLMEIGSQEDLDMKQKTGIPATTRSYRQSINNEEFLKGERCLTPYLNQADFPKLDKHKVLRNVLPTEHTIGEKKEFYSLFYNGDEPGTFKAEVAAVGETCTIWRDEAYRDLLSDEKAQSYAKFIDEIHNKLEESFGEWDNADVDEDGKTAFVFYPMEGLAGYFYAGDLFTKDEAGEAATNNVMDMLHMNIVNGEDDDEIMKSTLVHELQHLINFAQINYAQTLGNSDSWLNESFSQSAIAIVGLANSETVYEVPTMMRWINNVSGYTHPFIFKDYFVPEGETGSIPYGSWYLFGRYLAHQTQGLNGGGDAIYKTILNANMEENDYKSCTYENLEKALHDIGYMGEGKTVLDMDDLISNYNLALFLREETGIYSLNGGTDSNVNNVDGVEVEQIQVKSSAIEELPGGGASSFSISPSSTTIPDGYGKNMRFAGIREVLSGVSATPKAQEYIVYGTSVTLSTEDKNAKIYYTTDGSDPMENGKEYKEPIIINRSLTIKACSRDGNKYSQISEWDYSVIPAAARASVKSGWVLKGSTISLSCATQGAQILYTLDGSEPSLNHGVIYNTPIKIEETTTLKVMSFMPKSEGVLPGNVYTYTYETGNGDGDHYEPNNNEGIATAVSFPGKFEATLHNLEDVDVYAFELKNSANLNLTLTPPNNTSYSLTLCDSTGTILKESAMEDRDQSIRYSADIGKYLVKVASLNNSFSQTLPYTLSLTKELDNETVKNLDFSEMNMLTALTDKSENGSGYAWDLGINGGGNFLMSMAYLSHWDGPVAETFDPYHTDGSFNYQNKSSEVQYHVQNALYLPIDNRENAISNLKNAVYSYGAADIFVLSENTYFTPNYTALYVPDELKYKTEGGGGHIVTVVGWDDNYSRENFTGNPKVAQDAGYTDVEIPKPKNDGAFIIRNSWGDEVGEGGYFYLSYEDAFYLSNNPTVFIADELSNNYNRQYMNDPYGTTDAIGSSAAFTCSEVFTSEGKGDELLKAVSFVSMNSNTRYEISVTHNGKTQKVAEGIKKYAGYFTETINKPIRISKGDSFVVNVRLEPLKDDGKVSIGLSNNVNGVVSGIKPVEGVSFATQNEETVDYGAIGVFFNIRAYTCDVNSNSYEESVSSSKIGQNMLPKDTKLVDSLPNIHVQNIQKSGKEKVSVYGALNTSIEGANGAQAPVQNLPGKFDLRETNTMPPVRNQGNLGSCWTFAAIASVENNIARNGGFAIDHPTGLSLSNSEKNILLTHDAPEQSLSLEANLLGSESPASARINWSISGDVDSVRLDNTVSMNGERVSILTALKPGVVTVSATSDADMSITASCVVTITNQGVENIVLSPDKMTLEKGETGQLKATLSPIEAVDKTILWQSDHPEIASVGENGVVTAISSGKAIITAKAGTAQATVEVIVNDTLVKDPDPEAPDSKPNPEKPDVKPDKPTQDMKPGKDAPGTGVVDNTNLYITICTICAGLLALCLSKGLKFMQNKENQ